MSAEAWWRWLTDQLGTTVQVDIARLTQVEQSATSRWKSGHNRPRPEVVIAVCRTIGRPPVEGLIAAGYLQAGESAQAVQLMPDLDAIPDAELIGQLARRLGIRREAQEQKQSEGGPAGGGEGNPGAPIEVPPESEYPPRPPIPNAPKRSRSGDSTHRYGSG